MRDSITELYKLNIPREKWGQYDAHILNIAQRRVKGRGELLKFIRGQVTLADWLQTEYEEYASAYKLMEHCFERGTLYKKLNWIGYMWDAELRLWRLMRNRKAPKRINHEE